MTLTGMSGKIAVITGGAAGIGEAVAHRLSNEGARLVLVDINGEAVEAAAKRVFADTIAVTADVSTEKGTAAYVQQHSTPTDGSTCSSTTPASRGTACRSSTRRSRGLTG